jgi:uncharacterized protein YlxP (DUF503 family)
MPFAYCQIVLFIPGCSSLKEKRSVLARLLAQLRKRNVSVIESGRQDHWQQAELALAIVSADRSLLERQINELHKLIEEDFMRVQLTDFNYEIYL